MLLHTPLTNGQSRLALLKNLLIGLIASTVFFGPLAWALDSDRLQPLEISADSAELNEGEGYSIYSGNVIITQGTIRIEASTVKVTFNDDGIETMVATDGDGLAYMRQQSEPSGNNQNDLMEAWGKSIDYQLGSEYLILLGEAKLIQRGNQFSGNKIIFDIPKDYVKATGGKGKRVKMTFLPNTK